MQSPSKQKQSLGLVAWLIVSFAASGIGAVASIQAKSFYSQLVQPDWAPPPGIFGPVWTVLYAFMGIAAWLVWRSGGFRSNHQALTLFLLQLAVELAVFCLAPRRLGTRRRLRAVDPYRCHPCLFLARAPACRCAAHPLPAVGQFRIRTKLFRVATQSTGSRLVALLPGKYLNPTPEIVMALPGISSPGAG